MHCYIIIYFANASPHIYYLQSTEMLTTLLVDVSFEFGRKTVMKYNVNSDYISFHAADLNSKQEDCIKLIRIS